MKKSNSILKFLFLFGATALLYLPGQAQIHVAADGDAGIGTTSPTAKLHATVSNNSASNAGYFYNGNSGTAAKYGLYSNTSSAGTGIRYGFRNYTYNGSTNSASVYGQNNYTSGGIGSIYGIRNTAYSSANATGTMYGTYNYASATTSSTGYGLYNYITTSAGNGTRYGLYSRAYNNGNGATYGIYASVGGTGTGTMYAGYFSGDVHVSGNLTWTSDERKKENVGNLENALDLIAAIQPKTYTFKSEDKMNLPKGQQFGFLAQELEQALPDVVRTIEHPAPHIDREEAQIDEENAATAEFDESPVQGETSEELKAVNYIALIPILVQAVKEQQAEIEAQQAEIKALRKMLEEK